jgi:hypothetical protein
MIKWLILTSELRIGLTTSSSTPDNQRQAVDPAESKGKTSFCAGLRGHFLFLLLG